MSETREEFEKLPEIAKRLEMNCVYFNGTWYATNPHMGASFATAQYLNGAWYAFQEQQKIIDAYKLILKTQIGFDIANDVFECSKAPENQNILADCHNGVISKGEFLVSGQNSDGGQSKEMSINIGNDGKIIKTGD